MNSKKWQQRMAEFYRAMGHSKQKNSYWKRAQQIRRIVRWILWVWLIFCASISYAAYKIPLTEHGKMTALFNGSPEFTSLALLMALAAYLRSIHAENLRSLESLSSPSNWPSLLDQAYSHYAKAKKDHLENIVETLNVVAPFVVWLFVVLAIRIFADAFFRLFGKDTNELQLFFIADLIIALWMVLAFIGLMTAHRIARNRDSDLRSMIKYCEEIKIALTERPSIKA